MFRSRDPLGATLKISTYVVVSLIGSTFFKFRLDFGTVETVGTIDGGREGDGTTHFDGS